MRGVNLPRCVQTCWHSCFIQASKCGCASGANEAPRDAASNKGRTLKIRLRMNIVVQMCSVLLLIAASYSCSESVAFLCFVSNVFCTSFASALNFRFNLILGGGGWSELVRVVVHLVICSTARSRAFTMHISLKFSAAADHTDGLHSRLDHCMHSERIRKL